MPDEHRGLGLASGWTRFVDMHTGTLVWDEIYIEAPKSEAVTAFKHIFGRNPYNVTCQCCGADYTVDEEESLEQATAYQRNCRWDDLQRCYVECALDGEIYTPLSEYTALPSVRVIYADELQSPPAEVQPCES